MTEEEQTPLERSFTDLFHRLPAEPPPLGFRQSVLGRIARERARPWEWAGATLVAVPNLLFLLWQLLEHGDELARASSSLVNALLGLEEWDASASVHVDGTLLVSIALLGLAGLLVTHALVADDRSRSRASATPR